MKSRRGNSLLEFTLVAIPLIFLLISIVELSRGMWIYSTLAHSIDRGARFASVHGELCAGASSSCPVTVGQIAQFVRTNATGLDPGQMTLLLESAGASQSCSPLSSCVNNATAWPPAADHDLGQAISISGSYPFRSMMSMFWPGAGSAHFAAVTFGAKSREDIVF